MSEESLFFKSKIATIRFFFSSLALMVLGGCVGYVQGPRVRVYSEPEVFVANDDYIYYPGYDVYYSSRRHQYAYIQGGAWVSRPGPPGVSVNVLIASPSVRMDFHDSPANHHAEMVHRYPRNWAPPRSKPGRNSVQQGEHGENNRK